MAGNQLFYPGLVGQPDEVPEWAESLTPGEFRTFLLVLDAEMTRRGCSRYVLDGGFLRILVPDHQDERYGLRTFVRGCALKHPRAWPRMLRRHLDAALRPREHDRIAWLKDYGAEAAEYFKVRIVTDGHALPPDGEGVVYRRVAPGLRAVLVYDLGREVVTVPPDHARSWPEDLDELIEEALDNLGALPSPASAEVTVPGGGALRVLHGEDDFTAAQALGMDALLDEDDPPGALLAVPDARRVVFTPVHLDRLRATLGTMQPLVQHLHRTAATPLSPEVYWWSRGGARFEPVEAMLRATLADLDVARQVPWARGAN